MANLLSLPPATDAALTLIDGHFSIDFTNPLNEAGGGQPAFAARSDRMGGGFMAVQAAAGWPVRARMLTALAEAPIGNLLVPLGHGPILMPSGDVGYFVVSQAPPGRPLSADMRPWGEQDLVDQLIRPVALALVELHARRATHRAIRPDNLFRNGRADPVTLGAAWAAPAASRQPAVYEPPYVATCLAAGRGEGSPADDIYALGVLLVTLALGRAPMAGMDDAVIIRTKLEQGSFAAVTGNTRLPTAVAELARGMLADDPEHRPSAVLLGDPAAARARRAASRPQRRSQRPFPLGDVPAWTTQDLARAIMLNPEPAAAQLRNGAVGMWLRRGIGDAAIGSRIDEVCAMRDDMYNAAEARADALLAARAVVVLDPLAPIAWRRVALWPDGLGGALNHALHTDPAQAAILAEIATADVPMACALLRPARSDMSEIRAEGRRMQACLSVKQPEYGALRLNYTLNPLAPCESPLLSGRWVTRLAEILPALERAASGSLRTKLPPVDRHLAAFIAVRRDERAQPELGQLANSANAADPMSQLRLLARLQDRTHRDKLPALSAWLAEAVAPMTKNFQSERRRSQMAERLTALGREGFLPPMVALLDDKPEIELDKSGYKAAIGRGVEIDIELRALELSLAPRRLAATKLARDVTGGVSLAACGLALAAAAFL